MATAFRSLSSIICNKRKGDNTFDRHFELPLPFRNSYFLSADESSAFDCNLPRKQMGRPSS